MKWTKFNERAAYRAYVFVTDYCSAWPHYFRNPADWCSYANENPDYAWADIDTPEAPNDEHLCKQGSLECHTDGNEIILVHYGFLEGEPTKSSSWIVEYCPFCGTSVDPISF